MLNESEIMETLAEMKFVTAMTMPGRPCLDARCFFFQHEIEWLDHGENGYTVLFPTEDVESAFCRAMGMALVEQRVIDEVVIDLKTGEVIP
jgi:hypothetical protein